MYADTLSHAFMMYDVSGILQQLEGGPTKSGLGATTSAWTQLLQAAGHGMVPVTWPKVEQRDGFFLRTTCKIPV